MTRDDIINIAREVGVYLDSPWHYKMTREQEALEDFYKLAYEAGAKVERSKLFEIIKQVLDYELVLTNKFLDSNPKLSGFYFNRHHGIYDLFEHLKERIARND